MTTWHALIATIIGSLAASSGFWTFISNREDRRDRKANNQLQLILGVTHTLIVQLGMEYLNRGWISKDEYEDFMKYLVEPYETFGGNGLAKRVVDEINKLPLQHSPSIKKQGEIYK